MVVGVEVLWDRWGWCDEDAEVRMVVQCVIWATSAGPKSTSRISGLNSISW